MRDYEDMNINQLECALERIGGSLYQRGREDERNDCLRCYKRDMEREYKRGYDDGLKAGRAEVAYGQGD